MSSRSGARTRLSAFAEIEGVTALPVNRIDPGGMRKYICDMFRSGLGTLLYCIAIDTYISQK
jgi:hypothetical protein